MKFYLDQLDVGDVVKAQVTEVLDDTQVIISLQGDLIRAENETGRRLRTGEVVTMRVASTTPLLLRITESERRQGRLDIVT